jgi:plasmid stabilization system protein ParE
MVKIIWAPSALEDIDSIAEFISRDSPHNAALFVNRLLAATDRLKSFPESGRVIPEIGDPSRREIIYGAYRIMYRLEIREVWITGVVHGARNWRPEMD